MSLNEINVLLIEDNPGDARLIREYLTEAKTHFQVRIADRLADGQEMLATHQFQAVLLDLNLPDCSGLATFHKIFQTCKNIPIVILTGTDDEELARNSVHAGAQNYLVKHQLNASALERVIQYAIERYHLIQEMNKVNRTLKILSQVNRTVIRELDEKELIRNICRIAVQIGNYPLVWAAYKKSSTGKLTPVASASLKDDSMPVVEFMCSAFRPTECPLYRAMQSQEMVLVKDLHSVPNTDFKNLVLQRNYRSMIVFPIIVSGESIGTLNIFSATEDAFNPAEIELLNELTGDLSYGIQALRTRIQHEQSKTELKQSEQRFKSIIHNSADGVVLTDKAGTIIEWNSAQEQITGIESKEALGKPLWELQYQLALTELKGPQDYQLLKQQTQDSLKTGKSPWIQEISETPIRLPDGSTRYIQDRPFIIPTTKGYLLGSITRDVTEQKLAAEERAKMQQQLQQAQKMEAIGQLAGGVAHDFNNILTVISGNADLLIYSNHLDDSSKSHLNQIKVAAERAAGLTRQLLTFSRKQVIQPKPLDLNELVKNMKKMLRRLIGEDIYLDTQLSDLVMPIKADSGQLEQVIMNLVVNARDAVGPGGHIILETCNCELSSAECESRSGAKPGSYICLKVRDDGCGMDSEILSHIFEPFFTTKENDKGTGLGLAVIYGIVKQHNGWIQVESEPGRGSTFTVWLPTIKIDPKQPIQKSPVKMEPQGKGQKVLLIEDEVSVRALVSSVLQSRNYLVMAAASAQEALAIFKASDFDLIICDVVLPDRSGIDLMDELLKVKPNLKAIMSSGYLDDKSQYNAIQKRKLPFIQKPYDFQEFLKLVKVTCEPKAEK